MNENIIQLQLGIQTYNWGKVRRWTVWVSDDWRLPKVGLDSEVCKFLLYSGQTSPEEVDEEENYAELWLGAHHKTPNYLLNGQDLAEFLRENESILGERIVARFGRTLPFLLKVLSIGHPLQLQVHPSKVLARLVTRSLTLFCFLTRRKPRCCTRKTPSLSWTIITSRRWRWLSLLSQLSAALETPNKSSSSLRKSLSLLRSSARTHWSCWGVMGAPATSWGDVTRASSGLERLGTSSLYSHVSWRESSASHVRPGDRSTRLSLKASQVCKIHPFCPRRPHLRRRRLLCPAATEHLQTGARTGDLPARWSDPRLPLRGLYWGTDTPSHSPTNLQPAGLVLWGQRSLLRPGPSRGRLPLPPGADGPGHTGRHRQLLCRPRCESTGDDRLRPQPLPGATCPGVQTHQNTGKRSHCCHSWLENISRWRTGRPACPYRRRALSLWWRGPATSRWRGGPRLRFTRARHSSSPPGSSSGWRRRWSWRFTEPALDLRTLFYWGFTS